jgi:hypothetical protein
MLKTNNGILAAILRFLHRQHRVRSPTGGDYMAETSNKSL